MIKSKYTPENGIISIWNHFPTPKEYNYYIQDLDSNLCFTKGWISFPPRGYGELLVWEAMRPYVNSLGVRIQLRDGDNLIYSQDHYITDNYPQNYFYSNPTDLQYGSWHTILYEKEYEGLITFNENDVVYDLGANIGIFIKWSLQQSNLKQIYAFEPTPELVGYMNQTFEGVNNVSIFEKAISGKNTTAKFFTFESSVSNTLLDFGGKNETYKGYIEVECVNLEQFIKENNLLPPTIIKMDIESAEYDSIENMSDEFLSNIQQFILEYHENFNGEIWGIIKRFLNLGFNITLKADTNLSYQMGTIIFTK